MSDGIKKLRWNRLARVNVCETCGDKFHPLPAAAGRFCTWKCRQRFVRKDHAEPAPVRGARWIPLGRGRFSLVDAEDFERVSELTWSDDGRGGAHVFYRRVDGNKVTTRVRMHHFILGLPGTIKIDHRDGDQTNNRKKNLRIATDAQNTQNRHKVHRWGPPKSKYKCVWLHQQKGRVKWTAVITANGKRIYLGMFDTEEEAALAHDKAARELHGEFACLNFPRKGERSALR